MNIDHWPQVRKEYTLSYVLALVSLLCLAYLIYHAKPGFDLRDFSAIYHALAATYMLWCAIRLHRAYRKQCKVTS